MVRAKITKTTNSEGSEKDVEVANGVEVDPFEALKLQEQDHDVSSGSVGPSSTIRSNSEHSAGKRPPCFYLPNTSVWLFSLYLGLGVC